MNISAINTLVFVLIVFLLAFVYNVSRVTTEKIDLQNTVDEAVISATTEKARAMNALTASNHLIGELMSFAILHDAIGGRRIDEPGARPGRTPAARKRLREAFDDAIEAGVPRSQLFAFNTVKRRVDASKAILQSKIQLKNSLAECYEWKKRVKQGNSLINLILPKLKIITDLVGKGIQAGLNLWQRQVQAEYVALNRLTWYARTITPIRHLVVGLAIPIIRNYQDRLVADTPKYVRQAVELVARQDDAKVKSIVNQNLPVVFDPNAAAIRPTQFSNLLPAEVTRKTGKRVKLNKRGALRRQIAKTTQLARATYPYVVFHRKEVFSWGKSLELSRFNAHYKRFTFQKTVEWANFMQLSGRDREARTWLRNRCPMFAGWASRSMSNGLYILRESPTPNKGYAAWTEFGADHLFTVEVQLKKQTPSLLGGTVFGSTPKQQTAVAQATVYNANPQQRLRAHFNAYRRPVRYRRQALIGYDTLNFVGRVSEVVNNPKVKRYPSVHVNWQSRLVPTGKHASSRRF